MKVRVRDIAAKAGVSPATVSNALNNRPGVGSEIAESIRKLAEQMGYLGVKPQKPSLDKEYVRFVMVKRHGLVVMDTQFFAELVEGLERECRSRGLDLAITHIHIGQDADYRDRIRAVCSEKCAGIIVLATEMDESDIALFSPCLSPLIALDNLFRRERVSSVVMNNYNAGFSATDALCLSGHRLIHHITSTVDFNNMRYRREGYFAAMALHGLPADDACIWRVTPTLDGAYRDMLALLSGGRKPPTAFFAGNDIIAVGCMRALSEAGYSVPGDLSVIGMDDLSICEFCSPPLSTVRVYRYELGAVAVSVLLDTLPKISASSGSVKTELGVELIMRGSVAPPTEV